MKQSEKKILYAEDDADDRELLAEAIRAIDESINVVFAENGLRALDSLNKLKLNQELPCVIILDINMPYMDGKRTLAKIKADPDLKDVSVFIFTSSANPNDIAYFAGFGIEMITKPTSTQDFYRLAKHMLGTCF